MWETCGTYNLKSASPSNDCVPFCIYNYLLMSVFSPDVCPHLMSVFSPDVCPHLMSVSLLNVCIPICASSLMSVSLAANGVELPCLWAACATGICWQKQEWTQAGADTASSGPGSEGLLRASADQDPGFVQVCLSVGNMLLYRCVLV